MKDNLKIVKIGGKVISNRNIKDKFLDKFAQLEGYKILVHGGAEQANTLSKQMGIEPTIVNGRRITTREELEIVTMVFAGSVNKHVVAELQLRGINAMGLTGADLNSIKSRKRPTNAIDYGYVGDISDVNSAIISTLIKNEVVPVFCALTHDGNGELLNTNADTIASSLAIALGTEFETELIYCFEKQGVLSDEKDDDSVILHLDHTMYKDLKEKKVIHDGMLPKLENCFHALSNNVSRVIVGNTTAINGTGEKFTTLTL